MSERLSNQCTSCGYPEGTHAGTCTRRIFSMKIPSSLKTAGMLVAFLAGVHKGTEVAYDIENKAAIDQALETHAPDLLEAKRYAEGSLNIMVGNVLREAAQQDDPEQAGYTADFLTALGDGFIAAGEDMQKGGDGGSLEKDPKLAGLVLGAPIAKR